MKRTLRILGFTVLGILLFVVGVFLFFLSAPGKTFLGKQVSKYASTYLKTNVKAKVGYRIPDWVVLEDFLIEDQSKDTLLAGKSLRIDLDMWALLQSQVKINQVEVEGVHANVYRNVGNKDFNYQFLMDAFASDTTVSDTTSSKLMLEVRTVLLKDISANYRDDVVKNRARIRLASLETGFDRLDLDSSVYFLKDIDVKGLNAFIDFKMLNDSATVVQTTDATPAEVASTPFNIKLQDINLNDVRWNVRIEDLAVASKAFIKSMLMNVEGFDLDQQSIKMAALSLNIPQLSYDDLNAPKQPKGLDYGHLAINDFSIDAEDIYGSVDSVLLNLKGFKFKERSGVNIEEVSGKFSYVPSAFIAKDFLIQTSNTKLGDYLEIRHPDLVNIAETLEQAALNIDLSKSFIGLKDIELLAPDLAKNPYFAKIKKGDIFIDGKVVGKVADLTIPNLDIRGLNGSRLLAKGKIAGLPNVEKLRFDLAIKELSTTKSTLVTFLPDSIVQAYGLPQKVTLNGTLKGGTNDLTTTMTLLSDLGNGKIDGNFKNFVAEKATPKYDGTVVLNKFNLQKLLKNDSLRTATLNVSFAGTGIDPKTMDATAKGVVTEAYFNGYTYNDIQLNAGIAKNIANFSVDSDDSNLNGKLSGTANLSTEYPTIIANGNFQRLDFKALGLYAEPLTIMGVIDVDMASTNPSNPIGKVTFGQAAIDQGKGFVKLGDIALQLAEVQTQKTINLTSEFLNLNVAGQFDYQTVADVLLTEVATYFKVPGIEFTPNTSPNKFEMTGSVTKHPLITSFVPELTDFEPIKINATFDNTADESLTAALDLPYVFYDSIAVRNATFKLNTTASTASYNAFVNSVQLSSFRLRKAALIGEVANDKAGFTFTVKDSLDQEVHGLAGNVTVDEDIYKIAMQSEGTRLYYEPWQAEGLLSIYPAGIVAENVRFSNKEQELALNSQSETPNAPLDVTSRQINLKQLATAFLQDSTLVSGFLNADMVVKGLDGNPGFTGDFGITQLTVTQIPVGELKANANNKGSDAISLDASLTGEGNDFRAFGDYNLSGKNPLNITLDIKQLGAKTLQAFSFGEIERADGQMTGKLKITGETDDPLIKGNLEFPDFNFVVKQLGAPYSLKNQKVVFGGQSMQLNKFTLTDSLGQDLVVTGRVLFPDLPNFSYKMNVTAKNFLAVNAGRDANDYFFGKASIDASMDISGVNSSYTVNGDVKLVPGSNITVLMPEDDGVGGEMSQLITFVDRSNPVPKPKKEDIKMNPVLNASSEITLNVQVTDESELTVLVDELTGDYLRVRGNARLRTGFNASNELFLYGDYNITDGAYELSVSFARRKFDLLKGSYIRWTGDPLTADVNIKAAYTVQTSLNGYFVEDGGASTALTDALKRPIDVVLLLYLKNNLVNLEPSFAIAVKEDELNSLGINNIDDVRSQGVAIIKENGEIEDGQRSRFTDDSYINQQALWLLASGRFNPLSNTNSGGGFSAEAVARKSVSKLLSDQLNQLASNAIKGVDLNVGVASEYATETGERSTELNLGVSKTLLNDRLTVSVGRNFELEDAQRQSSEIFDNITASYKITEDGRYRLKAYRANQFQAIQGFVVETGIGVVLAIDYDKFREIFRKKEEDAELLKNIKKARIEEKQNRKKEEEENPEIVQEN